MASRTVTGERSQTANSVSFCLGSGGAAAATQGFPTASRSWAGLQPHTPLRGGSFLQEAAPLWRVTPPAPLITGWAMGHVLDSDRA